MNERQLKSFITAAEMKSLSKAAAASYISTPAFAQQINLLEDSLGFKLLNRGRRGIALTPSGEVFYKAAVEILSLYESAREECMKLEQREECSIKIACPSEQLPLFVMQACRHFQNIYPQNELAFIPSSLRQHLSDVKQKKADLAVMAEPAPKYLNGLLFYPLCPDTFSFCMRPDHPLSGKALISEADLVRYPVLCGRYEFLKLPFEKALPEGATICHLQDEYDASVRMRSQMSEELIIIHSHWASCYSNMLHVIPSDIPSGQIGVVCRTQVTNTIQNLIQQLCCTVSI